VEVSWLSGDIFFTMKSTKDMKGWFEVNTDVSCYKKDFDSVSRRTHTAREEIWVSEGLFAQ
jgi:hypothetical protein